MPSLILLVLALVLFGLATVDVIASRFNLIAGGLFCVTLAAIIGGTGLL